VPRLSSAAWWITSHRVRDRVGQVVLPATPGGSPAGAPRQVNVSLTRNNDRPYISAAGASEQTHEDLLAGDQSGRLPNRLGECGMRMNRRREVVGDRSHLDGHHTLRDHFADMRTCQTHPDQPLG